jgi:hypothetical protein
MQVCKVLARMVVSGIECHDSRSIKNSPNTAAMRSVGTVNVGNRKLEPPSGGRRHLAPESSWVGQ